VCNEAERMKKTVARFPNPHRAQRANSPRSPTPDRNLAVPLEADACSILGDFSVRFMSKNQRDVEERVQNQVYGADLRESRAVSIDFGVQITKVLAASMPGQPG
jgi:hypothetical protein